MFRIGGLLALVVALSGLAGCAADPATQLETVAKDWALTIRASQVIPVYPLSEDIQPGDVFLVPTSISEQTEIYEEKGFPPMDHLVTRLENLDYRSFYKDAYWKGTYAAVPHGRPGWTAARPAQAPNSYQASAPLAAFPTYSFTVDRADGLGLALPIQGIPIGLGLMGAARATGTITISDATTYAIDGESVYKALVAWYKNDPHIAKTFSAMARETDDEIYLRAVTRVYLTGKVDVSLANADTTSEGGNAGVAREIKLPDLTSSDPGTIRSATDAYKDRLDALSEVLNTNAGAAPGGSFRFTQVDRHTVSMSHAFARPLAIGFIGFDVKVHRNGSLSAPIPSFVVLAGSAPKFVQSPVAFCSRADEMSNRADGDLACPN